MKCLSRVALALALGLLVFGQVHAGVSVSLQPAENHVLPDRTLNIYIYVDSAGSDFNAYGTVIRWDSQVLQFVSWQPDTLFSNHNQWWAQPTVWPDSVKIEHSIMEGGVTETGPGAVSHIVLRSLQLGESPVAFRYIDFYRGGFKVQPVWTHGAVVYVESPNSGALESPLDGGNRGVIRIAPNPINDGTVLSWSQVPASESVLRLFNADGRLLQARNIGSAPNSCRLASLVNLHELPAGTYFVEVAGQDARMRGRFIRIKD